MELRFERVKIPVLADAVREVKHTELTQEVKLADGMPDIGRVLSCWGQIILRSKEWNRDEITVSGGVTVHTLYMPEDESEPRSVETWIPFQLSWDVDQNLTEGHIRIMPLVRFVDGRCVSPRKMMIRLGISAFCHGFSPTSMEITKIGELPEDVQILKRTYPALIPREAGEKTFLLDEELTVSESDPKVEKILSATLHPEITDRKVMRSRLVFKGNSNLHLVYRCPEGIIRTRDFEMPFSQYGDLDQAHGPEARGDVVMGVTNLDLDVTAPDRLRLKAGMVAQYRIDDREILEVAEDAYSPFRFVNPQRETLAIPSVLETRRETVHVRQEIPGMVDGAVDVTFYPDFPKVRRNGTNLDVEMPGQFAMLIQGEDGTLRGANARWDGNISIPADENTRLEVIPQILGQPGSEGTGADAKMEMQLRSQAETMVPMVTGLELGELAEPDPARPSVILRRAGEDELWQIAKENGSTVEAIRKANSLTDEPEAERMLLIPVA